MTECPLPDPLAQAFRSRCLTYRAIEDNGEDISFIRVAIQLDSVSIAQSDNEMFKPQAKKSTKGLVTSLGSKTLLGVMICLPKAVDNPRAESTMHEERHPNSLEPTVLVPIGFICLSGASPASRQSRNSTLSISISRQYRNTGYGSEAINWVLDWAFKLSGMHSVSVSCFSFNTRAERLYERLGFVREGRRRERIWFNRAWHDEILFSMLEPDWESLRMRDAN